MTDNGGAVRFDRFMDEALYRPGVGFYATGRGAGRRTGDFITSPQVGPLFGAVMADALDGFWTELGQPDPFVVAEAAAGVGTLAASIVAATPRCREALRYVMVEVADSARQQHVELMASSGCAMESTDTWPDRVHVGLANELLDNLPVRIVDPTTSRPVELYIAPGALDDEPLRWRPLDDADEVPAVIASADGIVPWAQRAGRWVAETSAVTDILVVFDYGAPTRTLAERGIDGWLRGYRDHHRIDVLRDAIHHVGHCDITADVPIDQLPEPTSVTTQAEWLRTAGIDERVAAARQRWHELAATGGLDAVRARSTVGEAEALTDPAGLGGFVVMTWR